MAVTPMRESQFKRALRQANNTARAAQKAQNASIRAAGPITKDSIQGKRKPQRGRAVKRLTVSQYEALPKIQLEQQSTNENRERWLHQAYLKQLAAENKKV